MQTDKENEKVNDCKGNENRKTISLGTWNITSVTNKEEQITEEMTKWKVDTLGISETKKAGKGSKKLIIMNSLYTIYSG